MWRKNGIITGVLAGIVLPAIAWVLFSVTYPDVMIMGKPGVPYFIAIALNLLIIRYAVNKELHKLGQGIIISTFVFMLLVFILKVKI